jgi:hypothetical protein
LVYRKNGYTHAHLCIRYEPHPCLSMFLSICLLYFFRLLFDRPDQNQLMLCFTFMRPLIILYLTVFDVSLFLLFQSKSAIIIYNHIKSNPFLCFYFYLIFIICIYLTCFKTDRQIRHLIALVICLCFFFCYFTEHQFISKYDFYIYIILHAITFYWLKNNNWMCFV